MIDHYEFGQIVIDGKTYDYDLLLYKDKAEKWWRKESHNVCIEDIEKAVSLKPRTIVIGTGNSGVMKVPEETREYIKSKDINLIIMKTQEACTAFNELIKKEEGALFLVHLTC